MAYVIENKIKENTYLIKCVDMTILHLLKELSHLSYESSAVCIKHHPHDEVIELKISQEELEQSERKFQELISTIEISPNLRQTLPPGAIYISCSSHIIAIAIKRTLETRIKTLVITEVRFKNKTVDEPYEKIAHQFGKIILKAPYEIKQAVAHVAVSGRNVFASDIIFETDKVSVSENDANIMIVPMSSKDEIELELICESKEPMGNHAKFKSVATPTWEPELKLYDELKHSDLQKVKNLYWVDKDLIVHSVNPSLPVRKETFQELLPHVETYNSGNIIVGVESLGHRSAAENVDLALVAIQTEISDLISAIKAFENIS